VNTTLSSSQISCLSLSLYCIKAIKLSLYRYISVSPCIHCMDKMNVVQPDDVEERFSRAVFERMGMKKGNISEALEEAVDLWMHTKMRGEK
jgi:hypothetical protein